jgi:hypothetical protein
MSNDQNKLQRHIRALKKTAIVGLFAVIPVLFLYYVTINFSASQNIRDLAAPDFLMTDSQGGYFTNQSLIGKVTYMAYIPASCADCENFIEKTNKVHKWSLESLKKLEHFQESDVHLTRVLISSHPTALSTLATWEKVSESDNSKIDVKHLIEACGDLELKPYTIIFDREARIRGCVNQESMEVEKMKRLLSKVTFNTSMDEYLSERTFFGKRKKHDEDIENGN